MRVVVTGATGNVGTSLLQALATDDTVTSVVGISRRVPDIEFPKTQWVRADVSQDDLVPHFEGADAVVHLAWLIQPSRDEEMLAATNVTGSERVFAAVARAGVPALVYASSIGAYSPGPKDYGVDESWPTHGVPTSFYARHKAAVERLLDDFEGEHPETRVVRLRPGLIFKRDAASEVRRLFAGPFLPSFLLRRGLIPFIPSNDALVFQAVHSLDAGEAYRLAVTQDVRGAFNIAAEPVLSTKKVAELLGARPVTLAPSVFRVGAAATWRLHLQPTPAGWVDMAFNAPVMDVSRARDELGWKPQYTSSEALLELLDGMRTAAGIDTPPLSPRTGGPVRLREVLQGIGRRSGV